MLDAVDGCHGADVVAGVVEQNIVGSLRQLLRSDFQDLPGYGGPQSLQMCLSSRVRPHHCLNPVPPLMRQVLSQIQRLRHLSRKLPRLGYGRNQPPTCLRRDHPIQRERAGRTARVWRKAAIDPCPVSFLFPAFIHSRSVVPPHHDNRGRFFPPPLSRPRQRCADASPADPLCVVQPTRRIR